MKNILFSIVIPTLNEEKYLPKLLTDLLNQTNQDYEVIVVDGNSEDTTVKKCLEFEKKLSSLEIISSRKRNVSYQRNLGAKRAKGEWIIFMDADNRLPKYFMDGVMYRIYKEKPDCFTTYCTSDRKKPTDKAVVDFINLGMEITKLMDAPTTRGSMIGVKRKIFVKFGGFNEKMSFAEDSEYVKRLFNKGISFKIFKDPRYTYSLRHYRKDGKLNYLGKTARLHLKNLAGLLIDQLKEYPMGGTVEEKKDVEGLSEFFRDIKTALKKPKIFKKIGKYLSYLEEEK